MMNKKILIGSMLVLALLLLMPSIPAIQQKSIEEGIKQDIKEKLDTITGGMNNHKDFEDRFKHPFLFIFILSFGFFRMLRGGLMQIYSSNDAVRWYTYEELEIYYPLIYARGSYLSDFGETWLRMWEYISYKLGWNWWT